MPPNSARHIAVNEQDTIAAVTQRAMDVLLTEGFVEPTELSERLWQDLDLNEKLVIAHQMFRDFVRDIVRRHRNTSLARGNVLPERARYGKVRAAIKAGLLDVAVDANGWRRLGDCTLDQLRIIVAGYERRASDNEHYAKKYRQLAEEMETRGVATVDDLGEATVRTILGDALSG